MKKKLLMERILLVSMGCVLAGCALTGCGSTAGEAEKKPITIDSLEEPIKIQEEPIKVQKEDTAGTLLDSFLAGTIPANYADGEAEAFYITELDMNEEDALSYSVGDRVDLDNDGEQEQIINGAYGGIYLDARDGKVYVLTRGSETISTVSYINYEGKNWIVHSDTTHSGRIMYDFTLYDGSGQVVDAFNLNKEFWNHPEEPDGPETVYTYKDEQITREAYEEWVSKIFGN